MAPPNSRNSRLDAPAPPELFQEQRKNGSARQRACKRRKYDRAFERARAPTQWLRFQVPRPLVGHGQRESLISDTSKTRRKDAEQRADAREQEDRSKRELHDMRGGL